MSYTITRSDCRKFAPNIFNKSKCTNCFRQKEEHSAEALESNRASRKVSKCGYLFVAPGWDFSNPLNRTKRWQRRWFVLYDDGELSYSVDEHPDTVPQASIDMNKVVEVSDAEDVTGNAYSLAVTALDRVHFVKATCREEYRWWLDVLAVFPRSKGRHKRNSTFPGVQPISISQQPILRASTPISDRPHFNTEPRKPACNLIPSLDTTALDQPVSSSSPPTRDRVQSEEKSRTRRVANRERRGIKTGRSFSEDFSGMLPSWRDQKSNSPVDDTLNIFDEYAESRREEKLKDIADSLTRPRYRRNTQSRSGAYTVRPNRDGDCSEEERKGFGRPASPANLRGSDEPDTGDKPVRGDPDGCGLDISAHRYSPSSERRVDLPAEDLLNIKKGWLMKQAPNQDWVKHWFVLRGAALMYYRDPTAEDKGILDGVIDLSGVSSVVEVLVARNYGFQTLLWDERRYVLSAVTAGIRGNWMSAIRKAAGLKEALTADPISMSDKKDHDLVNSQLSISVQCPTEREASLSSIAPRSILFSSDEEYRTASEGGRRESQDWGEQMTPLPPSPPLNRTPISRVKEKARSRTNNKAGVYKRSKSSPPSSRRSTLDSVLPDELILGELPESEADDSLTLDSSKSSLITVDGSISEVQDLKLQLNVALREVSDAEHDRLKLRNCRSEVTSLEKQVQELLGTLEQIQTQLEHKTKVAEEVESLRKRYEELLRDHEGVLTKRRQQAMEEDWKELYMQIQERYRQDSETWQRKLDETETALEETASRYEMLNRDTIEHLHCEVISLSERLAQGIEENDSLYRRVRELEGRGSRNSLSACRERGRSVDSLSDLTNIDLDLNLADMDKERIAEEYEDLRGRFEKAVQEIRAMKRELRESHTLFDDLELSCIALRQDATSREQNDRSQTGLMVARIDDLTLKLSAAEKQVRTLKQKTQKSDSREKRRSLSLKGRESFQIGKELEEKLAELESKIVALESGIAVPHAERSQQGAEKEKRSRDSLKVTARLRRKSLDSATSSEPMKVLIRLSSLEAKVAQAAERAGQECITLSETSRRLHPEVNIDRASEDRSLNEEDFRETEESIGKEVSSSVERLESLLKSKLSELAERRAALKQSGEFDSEARTRLLAEKLAYESVLVARIARAVESSQGSESFRSFLAAGEISETDRLIDLLKSKLRGEDIKPCDTSTQRLTRILTHRLLLHKRLAFSVVTQQPGVMKCKLTVEQVEAIKNKQKELNAFIEDYRTTTLDRLARSLALETLSIEGEERDSRPSLEDRRIRDAWTVAQETVNRELIQAEISHVMMRCGQAYEAGLSSERKTDFSLLGSHRVMLEQWTDKVEQTLQREMEVGIEDLTLRYEICLDRLKRKKNCRMLCDEDVLESRSLLSDFADISAHKALIDARVEVLCEGNPEDSRHSSLDLEEVSGITSLVQDHLGADFQFLYEGFARECVIAIGPEESPETHEEGNLSKAMASLSLVEDELTLLTDLIGKEFNVDPPISRQTSWMSLQAKCIRLAEQISQVTRSFLRGLECQRCTQLQEAMLILSKEHEEELRAVKECQEQERSSLQGDLEKQRHALVSQHEEEQEQLKERARRLERRLGTLDSEYMQQVDNLRAAYHKTLSSGLERDVEGEENIRQRYRAEIEQLRALCEKGLAAMESSHRRIIAEIEEKHRQELEQLHMEKDQALAEETQATLAALDAMRKAHETEVQKEIVKFKTEFVRKMHLAQDNSALHKEQEAEMEEIKQEILSLSEKYSVKCVESASYEEQLGVVNKKLIDAQQHILQLDSRNKQLRAHLVSEASEVETADAAQLLRRKSRELVHQNELQKKLSIVNNHGEELSALCSRLRDEYYSAERSCAENPVLLAKLWDKVQQLTQVWPPHSQGAKINPPKRTNSFRFTKDECVKSKHYKEPTTLSNAELIWSPRCGLSRSPSPFLSSAQSGSLRSSSPSPLCGMVAERKKIFES